MPFCSWCSICVKANGREEARRNGRGKESCKATISFDHKTFGQEDERDDIATATVYEDDHTQVIFGHVCERKETSETWVIGKMKEDIGPFSQIGLN